MSEMKGFDDAINRLKKLERDVRNLDGTQSVPLNEVLTPSFLQSHTQFADLGALIEASGFKVDSAEDFKNIPDAEWDAFISKNTNFPNWEEMLGAAGAEWTQKKLGL